MDEILSQDIDRSAMEETFLNGTYPFICYQTKMLSYCLTIFKLLDYIHLLFVSH